MAGTWKRREFLHAVAAGGALGGLAWGADDEPRLSTQVNRQAIEAEVRRRADRQLEAVRLVVDYYRIGRKIAYPLPLEELIIPEVNVPSIPVYPWATWLTWTLEERIGCLGWAAQWFDHKEARQRAAADLAALARWPRFQQYANPDLSSAHAGRILWTAATRWGWVESGLRKSLHEACRRHVEAVLPASDKLHASIRTKDDVLRRDAPHALLHNIPLIGAIGAALTAATAGHPAAELLNERIHALFGAVLDLRAKGYTEGVAYDGYVLDFAADWLAALPDGERSDLLDHPGLNQYLEQSYMLGAPGAAEQVAELSDVEPREMPFHLSAQAKLLRLRPDPLRWWLLGRCPLDVLRCDALAALGGAAGVPAIPAITAITAPPAGALDAHYAAVLRSGWEADDLAVAVSCSSSPMGHIQNDAGALVIGTHGRWLITDPGYQQYVQGDQREFTVGPAAHNAPLVNGSGPAEKRPRRIVLDSVSPTVHRVAIDLTACYPAAVKSLVRHVWLSGKNLVVVADELDAGQQPQAVYHWHGHPDAAWWFEAGWALVALGAAQLWVACSRAEISGADLQRLAGSRGQLSLVSTIDRASPVVWWVFALAANRPALEVDVSGRQIRVLGQSFSV